MLEWPSHGLTANLHQATNGTFDAPWMLPDCHALGSKRDI